MVNSSLAQLSPFGRVPRPMFISGFPDDEVRVNYLQMSMNRRPTKGRPLTHSKRHHFFLFGHNRDFDFFRFHCVRSWSRIVLLSLGSSRHETDSLSSWSDSATSFPFFLLHFVHFSIRSFIFLPLQKQPTWNLLHPRKLPLLPNKPIPLHNV